MRSINKTSIINKSRVRSKYVDSLKDLKTEAASGATPIFAHRIDICTQNSAIFSRMYGMSYVVGNTVVLFEKMDIPEVCKMYNGGLSIFVYYIDSEESNFKNPPLTRSDDWFGISKLLYDMTSDKRVNNTPKMYKIDRDAMVYVLHKLLKYANMWGSIFYSRERVLVLDVFLESVVYTPNASVPNKDSSINFTSKISYQYGIQLLLRMHDDNIISLKPKTTHIDKLIPKPYTPTYDYYKSNADELIEYANECNVGNSYDEEIYMHCDSIINTLCSKDEILEAIVSDDSKLKTLVHLLCIKTKSMLIPLVDHIKTITRGYTDKDDVKNKASDIGYEDLNSLGIQDLSSKLILNQDVIDTDPRMLICNDILQKIHYTAFRLHMDIITLSNSVLILDDVNYIDKHAPMDKDSEDYRHENRILITYITSIKNYLLRIEYYAQLLKDVDTLC